MKVWSMRFGSSYKKFSGYFETNLIIQRFQLISEKSSPMGNNRRTFQKLMLALVSFTLLFSILACDEGGINEQIDQLLGLLHQGGGYTPPNETPEPFEGEVKGTGSVIWDIPGLHVGDDTLVTCSDESADYKMVISFPEPSAVTQVPGSLPKGSGSFRLDAYVVEYPVKDKTTVCNYDLDPSDERVDEPITGTYTPSNYQFSILSCGSGWDLSESEIYHTAGNKISGNITCQRGQGQEKLTLKFTDMVMSGMLPDIAH
jgi:hypothetical protein